MTKNHHQVSPAGVVVSSAPVWEVYPFRLKLSCSEKVFHRERARIRMRLGFTPLDIVADAMIESEKWQGRSEQERLADAKRIADALHVPEEHRAILGC